MPSQEELGRRSVQQAAVFVGVQAEALHLPRQVGAQSFGGGLDPGRDGVRRSAQLRLG